MGVGVPPPTTETAGDLFLIKDPDGTLVVTLSNGQKTIDFLGAWNLFRAVFGDNYDFVGFFLDTPSGMPVGLGSASSSVYNAVTGIGVPIFDGRGSFNTNKLLSFAWYGASTPTGAPTLTLTEMLHELGHQWLASANYKDSSGQTQTLLHQDWIWNPNQSGLHWGRWPDHRNSCMSYDQ